MNAPAKRDPKTAHTRHEPIEMITPMAFYTGWPNSWSAMNRLRELLPEEKKE
jgi:alkylhydroperoxidase/carboxymuconolactone decarboxylase family protein YurZ